MNHTKQFSDELLNAYVDRELDDQDRARIEQAAEKDTSLRKRINELQRLKQLVRGAYVQEVPSRATAFPSSRWPAAALAASVAAFAMGAILSWGWLSYTGGGQLLHLASKPAGESSGVETDRAIKVLFHLNRNDSVQLGEILDEAEALLMTASHRNLPVAVRVIASGSGLSLFGKESTPAKDRIVAMKQAYQNQLIFNGCSVAYKQLSKRAPEGDFELLPVVELVDLGVLELMRRQHEGWAYIRL